jgi:hypothetical protein
LPLITQLLAVLCKLISRRLQTMVNVNGPDLPWPLLSAGQQQGCGICTAAERDGDGQGGLKTERQQNCAACRIIC